MQVFGGKILLTISKRCKSFHSYCQQTQYKNTSNKKQKTKTKTLSQNDMSKAIINQIPKKKNFRNLDSTLLWNTKKTLNILKPSMIITEKVLKHNSQNYFEIQSEGMLIQSFIESSTESFSENFEQMHHFI